MGRPLLVDLFCGAGGASMGYYRAGFDVLGVDHKPQPHYPFDFVRGDVFDIWGELPHDDVAAYAASPPCQAYSVTKSLHDNKHPDFVAVTRALFVAAAKPYAIENVPGAPLLNPVLLCGTMFGLCTSTGAQLRRHRLFEATIRFELLPPCAHKGRTIGIFGDKARDTGLEKRHYQKPSGTRGDPPPEIHFVHAEARRAMGIDWMNIKELSQAIPPAYTEWIGKRLMQVVTLSTSELTQQEV